MGETIATIDEFRLRLIDLEYKDLSKEEMTQEIERIYLEEYGKELEAEINIFHSSESSELKGDDSGYDGTAIQFVSKEQEINEVYIISQGTQDMVDWQYNMKAMFAGLDYSQTRATDLFVEDALEEFQINREGDHAENIPVIGLSHSLAHNNNATAELVYDTFDKVYSVNGAQTNYYQLFYADDKFRQAVRQEFSISMYNSMAVHDLNPEKLQTFAEEYYSDKAENIHQLISRDDPLYAVSGTRGFFTLGEVNYIDTNPDYPGLREAMDDIPDDVIKDFQDLAIRFTIASNNGGTDAALHELLGVDVGVLEELDGATDYIGFYMTEADEMLANVNKKLPGIMEQVHTVTNNADVIFGRLMDAGYITEEQKEELVEVVGDIEHELNGIVETIDHMEGLRGNGYFFAQIGGDAAGYFKIKNHYEAILSYFEVLRKEEYLEILEIIGESHGIPEMLHGLSDKDKSYVGTDMVLHTTSGGKDIRVNLSASLRMYTEGKLILQEKQEEIARLANAAESEIEGCFDEEKLEVISKINDIEANPGTYRQFLRNHMYFPRLNKTIRRINVHEEFYPLHNADLHTELTALQESVTFGYTYLEKYRKAIEGLFNEDERISTMFDLADQLFGTDQT
ncbi:DUF6792 domain-containing protein [Oceanobacillus senegalensis]|uniref:DUF6792 domain-containing protein n=1 Tax=Oceanobacillus senegalensis TaxID=1936063 RepID=UPI000A306298|nr:DUF6792 domain-containing protein [Oceanobacillus senegalensis]